MSEKVQCPEFPFFGANYPDARCIDGYLWDLDSCDVPGGPLFFGGDEPCPFCNQSEAIERLAETLADESEPEVISKGPFREEARKRIVAFCEKNSVIGEESTDRSR